MDKMQDWEVAELYNVIPFCDYAVWESTRMLLSTQVDHKKVKKLTDIMKFAWDSNAGTKNDTSMSNQDKARLKAMSEAYGKLLND